ncbi:MAG: PIG-L family deacetylase, partial [Bacteroidota bacterium]
MAESRRSRFFLRSSAFLLLFVGCSGWLMAQTGFGPTTGVSAAGLLEEVRALQMPVRVLYLAAHPDDENTRMLTWLSKGMRVEAAYLSLTRGDGGQNLIGKEAGDELGLIRTYELMGARSIDGARQFFTRANDFGYSKTPEETFRQWDRDSLLADVVWVIRLFRPHVIITRFTPEPSATHGHHTASAQLAVEAFHAAADPKRFPDHFTFGVNAWTTKTLYWNT